MRKLRSGKKKPRVTQWAHVTAWPSLSDKISGGRQASPAQGQQPFAWDRFPSSWDFQRQVRVNLNGDHPNPRGSWLLAHPCLEVCQRDFREKMKQRYLMQSVTWTSLGQHSSAWEQGGPGGPRRVGLWCCQALLALIVLPASPAWSVLDFFALLYKRHFKGSLGAV